VVGALGSCFAPNIEAFFCLRLLMALGAAASAVVSSAIVRDLYVGSPMIKMLSRVFFIQGLAPIAGPILGAQLLKILNWQQVFLFFGGFAVLILLLTSKFLVETLHSNKRRVKGFDGMAGRFRAVLRDRIYVGLLIVSVVQTIALFSYLNVFSFLYQQGFHISLENFGWFFAMNSACSWAGVQLASKLARSFPPQWILLITLVLATFVGFGLLVAGLTNGPFALVAALLAAFMLVFGATITPISAISLAQHGSEAGTAASLMGVLNFVITSLVSPLYGYLTLTTSAGVGGVIAGCYLVALLSMIFIVRPSTVPVMAR
jgi:DHA1 family bicyclomycin/chloramphenicol resistance-like MFS transporter